MTDFDLLKARTSLLASLAPDGPYGSAGFDAVFYYDEASGYFHAYAPMSWDVLYDAAGFAAMVTPIRETETTLVLNDHTHPNCAGAYGLDPALTVVVGCKAQYDHPAWGGGKCARATGHDVCQPTEGPVATRGYALLTELQQVFSLDLATTLCAAYPGQAAADADGFYDPATKGCITSKWDPTASGDAGLPTGDWCSRTNSAASATCHDAMRVSRFQTFAGAKIQLASPDGPPATCPF